MGFPVQTASAGVLRATSGRPGRRGADVWRDYRVD